ncbi:MAG TPA: hypothetical protein VGB85_32545, partial [Nannocystis sp.]
MPKQSGDPPSRPHPDPDTLLRRGTSDHYEDAELYDFEYRDHGHDVTWYRNLAKKLAARRADPLAGPLKVLELGAGTG